MLRALPSSPSVRLLLQLILLLLELKLLLLELQLLLLLLLELKLLVLLWLLFGQLHAVDVHRQLDQIVAAVAPRF